MFLIKNKSIIGFAACLSLLSSQEFTGRAASFVQGVRSQPVSLASTPGVGFTLVPAEQSGIWFTNTLSLAAASENQIRANGSGVAAGDVDGDGRCDLYFCRMEGGNVLYKNLGNWKFEDVTSSAGVACENQNSSGAIFADVDGDGDLDLLVTSLGGGTRLFLNDGKGHFTESQDSGLVRRFGATSMALADVDGDGDLDLYVVNNRTTTIRDTGMQVMMSKGKRIVQSQDRDHFEFTPEGTVLEYGEPDCFYLNDGKGHFTHVSWTGGAFLDENGKPLQTPPRDWGFAAQFRDMNQDGLPDLYVSNDFFSPDRIWINKGHGVFQAISANALTRTSLASMVVDFADINRDGFDDFIVGDLLSRDHRLVMTQHEPNGQSPDTIEKLGGRPQVEHTTLFLNRGDGTYAEIAHLAGLEATEWTWGMAFLDVDLDGYEDLLVANGHGFNALDTDTVIQLDRGPRIPRNQRLQKYPRLPRPKLAFRNRGDLTFEEVGHQWGFDGVAISNGMALADLDNDGDLDVIINNLNGRAFVFRNDATAPRIGVRLKGKSPNTFGISARMKITAPGMPVQSQEMISGGRYLSSDDPMRVFAAGNSSNRISIDVTWPSGTISSATNLASNAIYEISEENAYSVSIPSTTPVKPLFEDTSALLGHEHVDPLFDDFARQPLLPHNLGRLGPGVAWFDWDEDGFDDLIIAGGAGGSPAFLHNDKGKTFSKLALPMTSEFTHGQTAVVAMMTTESDSQILIGSSNYRDGNATNSSVIGISPTSGVFSNAVLGHSWSVGPLALADLDGDGDLDLFVGARVIPGRYPEAARSEFYRNEGGSFSSISDDNIGLRISGLVTAATFSDINGDGWPDLVVATEWGPVRLFINHKGRFEEQTAAFGLDALKGWWTSIAIGDFEGDGRLDIVAGNWGRNSKYHRFMTKPLRLYFGDLNEAGGVDLAEVLFDREMNKYVPWQDLETFSTAIRYVGTRFSSFKAYADASISEILGDKISNLKIAEANTLDSMIFLNRGDHFEARPLPVEAQFAPVFGLATADFDGDGNLDLLAAQNFFGVRPDSPKYDAGRGLLLLGDGHGGLRAVSGQESGVMVYGEQRGVAISDYDHDGRPDAIITQNHSETKLLHNSKGKPGLRVKLHSDSGNSAAIGAVLRLICRDGFGPAQEIHAGSGYWSQDSSTLVMTSAQPSTGVWVRWPGGNVTQSVLPVGATAVFIEANGVINPSDQ